MQKGEYVDEVAVIDTVSEDDVTKKLLKSEDNILVYYTLKENIALNIRNRIGLRGVFRKGNQIQ